MRIVGSAVLCCVLSSCASTPQDSVDSPLIEESAKTLAPPLSKAERASPALKENLNGRVTLDDCGHPSGACRQIRETARESYLFAQIATNAYNESSDFELGPRVKGPLNKSIDDKTGFGAQLYYLNTDAGERACVIAYRGTDFFSLQDWVFGNLFDVQYQQGLDYYKKIRESERQKSEPCTQFYVVGHSLGGAIATHVSLWEADVAAFIFNNSPRLRRGPITNKRVAVSQYGEVLAVLRRPFINAGGTYTMINCKKGNPISRHAMRPLAECLTEIAAADSTLDQLGMARASAELNLLKPDRRILGASLDQ